MSTDRKLLELAAKAAGFTIHAANQAARDACGAGDVGLWISTESTCWNPLTDDGDALRLAAELGIKVVPYPIFGHEKHSVIASRLWWAPPGDDNTYVGPEVIEVYGDDRYAATRRAIVRAAAALKGEH